MDNSSPQQEAEYIRKNPDRSQIQQEILQKPDRTRPHAIIILQRMLILKYAHATIMLIQLQK